MSKKNSKDKDKDNDSNSGKKIVNYVDNSPKNKDTIIYGDSIKEVVDYNSDLPKNKNNDNDKSNEKKVSETKSLNITVGLNIRYLRNSLNLTTEDFSESIGISPNFLGLLERGNRGLTTYNLSKIVSHYDVSANHILLYESSSESEGETLVLQESSKSQLIKKTLIRLNNLTIAEIESLNISIDALKHLRPDPKLETEDDKEDFY